MYMSEKIREEEKDKILILEKGKRGFWQIVFGRTGVILILLLLQFVLLFFGFRVLGRYIPYLYSGYLLVSLILVIYILNKPKNPAVQITWMVLIMAVPVVGGFLYLFVELQIGHRFLHWRLQEQIKETKDFARQKAYILDKIDRQDRGVGNLVRYMNQYGPFPIYENTHVTYFPLGEDAFEEILVQLEKAEKYIFLEFFIVNEGYMWGRVLKILEEKVEQGVEVRVMYDGTCTLMNLPWRYPEDLKKLGIKCKIFSPIQPILSTHYNNRDHRKILVIDGKVGFTGGINFADEYINRKVRFGHWKDTAVMLEGAAVENFMLMFLQMWNISEVKPDYMRFLEKKNMELERKEGFVMPYGDSPLDNENVGEMVYLDMISRAEHYVHIMTPYLILDYEMLTALKFAAKRGVEVMIILPHIPDKKYAFALARQHYQELIHAGVKIYEYTPGFVHAKVVVCDNEEAVVGTINFDYRSLYLHFECATYMFQCPVIADIEQDMTETMQRSHRITMEDYKKTGFFMKLMGKVLKILAPLM